MNDLADEAAILVAQLLTHQYLPRSHPRVRRALADAELFQAVEQRLSQVGLRWVDNIYAEHVTLSLTKASLLSVQNDSAGMNHNNLELPRDAVALLVVLWALIVLPKRERQASPQESTIFRKTKCLPAPSPCLRPKTPAKQFPTKPCWKTMVHS